jgi:hypothetical protein
MRVSPGGENRTRIKISRIIAALRLLYRIQKPRANTGSKADFWFSVQHDSWFFQPSNISMGGNLPVPKDENLMRGIDVYIPYVIMAKVRIIRQFILIVVRNGRIISPCVWFVGLPGCSKKSFWVMMHNVLEKMFSRG